MTEIRYESVVYLSIIIQSFPDHFQRVSSVFIKPNRAVDTVWIHCCSSSGMSVPGAEVNQWHVDRGWSGIGYHFFIYIDGTLELGRPLEKRGALVKDYNSSKGSTLDVDQFAFGEGYQTGLNAKPYFNFFNSFEHSSATSRSRSWVSSCLKPNAAWLQRCANR